MKTQDPLVGRTINDKYKIFEKIGSGGQSKIYKAKQSQLNRFVALKCIIEDIEADSDQAKRFIREAEDLARLRHPNVVTVYESGHQGDVFYIAMEYLEGLNLSQIVKQQGRIDQLTTIKYMASLAAALDHIHNSDLVHSDVKSSNIIIAPNDRPVLMDLGIAIQTDKTILDGGDVVGTPEYMSPEQASGKALDERTDLYSLGVVMYECLTGRVPFHGKTVTVTTNMVLNEEPVPPIQLNSEIWPWLNDLIMTLLSKEADVRIENARELSIILEQHLHSSSAKTTTKQKRERSPEEKRKRDVRSGQKTAKNSKRHTVSKTRKPVAKGKTKSRPSSRKIRITIAFVLLGFLVLLVPLILWYAGIFEDNNSQRQGSVNLTTLSSEQISSYKSIADGHFRKGDFVLAHRYYSTLRHETQNSTLQSLIKDNYLESKQKVIEYLLSGISMQNITEGTFTMGKPGTESDHSPEHTVTLSPYSLSKYEITMEQYLIFLNAHYCNKNGFIGNAKVLDTNHSGLKGQLSPIAHENELFVLKTSDNLPVYGVTWEGANMFCEFLGGRLPTEAEWEYAARARSNLMYSGGNNPNQVAWYADNASEVQAIGELLPNSFELYDLSGNVWEWCSDYYDSGYYQTSEESDPTGPEQGQARVIRGGDIHSSSPLIASTYRSFMYEDATTNDCIGFRLCN